MALFKYKFFMNPVSCFRCAIAALAEHAEGGVGLFVALDGHLGALELKDDITRISTSTRLDTFQGPTSFLDPVSFF